MFKKMEDPAVQFPERMGQSCWWAPCVLSRKHIFHLVGVEVQINQKAAPDDKGEKRAQAWCEGFLVGGRNVGDLGPG